jgi:S13-like H2TH domain
VTIPPLSDEQRQQARNAATQARRRRAEIKQALRSGERSLAEVLALAEQDDVVAHTKVIDVLKALPRVGSVRAAKVMERLDIAANRRLRGLGKHQTAALVAEFSAKTPAGSGGVPPGLDAAPGSPQPRT